VAVLGPVELWRDGQRLPLGTRKQQAVVTALALGGGAPVDAAVLIDRLWGEHPPATAQNTLQSYVAGLRRLIGDRDASGPRVLLTRGSAYALVIDGSDAEDLGRVVSQARSRMALLPDPLRSPPRPEDRPTLEQSAGELQDALALWRGQPFAELGAHLDAVTARARLEGERLAGQELRMLALLGLGRHREMLAELHSLAAEHRLHERLWAMLAVALARSGRQAEALGALQDIRAALGDELGVDPSAELREIHVAILRQDAAVVGPATDDVPQAGRHGAPGGEAHVAQSPRREAPPVARWQLVGRATELGRLSGVLAPAGAGHPQLGVVVGEPGVGKTRLALELMSTAFTSGFAVAAVACTDTAAPDAWPWSALLEAVEAQSGRPVPADLTGLLSTDPYGFAARPLLAAYLREASRDVPLVLTLEDLQWADRATVELLLHVADHAAGARLVLLVTRRGSADPAMTDVLARLARRADVRVDLAGLDAAAGAELVAQVTDEPVDVDDVVARSGGNPFVLIELARTDEAIPGTLADIAAGQLAAVAPQAREVVRAASVLGNEVDAELVAAMGGWRSDEVAAALRAAREVGILRESPGRGHGFAHPVVREVVHASLEPHERGRWHARAAATIASGPSSPERRAAAARHWRAAGHLQPAPAWRALVGLAERAHQEGSWVEESDLLATALHLHLRDTSAHQRERYDVLMLRADACRWSGDWDGVTRCVDDAVEVAAALGDTELVTRAAISTAEGALWQTRAYGEVHAPIVYALERAVARLDDGPLRCRALVGLALELSYAGDPARVDALVEEAITAAEKDGDLRLLATVYQSAFSATWRPDTAWPRVDLAERLREVSDRLGDVRVHVMALTLRAGVAYELGEADVVRALIPAGIQLAQANGLGAAEGVLRAMQVTWLAMEGSPGVADEFDRLTQLLPVVSMPQFSAVVPGTQVAVTAWREPGEIAAALAALAQVRDTLTLPLGLFAAAMALRAGDADLAAEFADEPFDRRLAETTFMAVLAASLACEVGLGLARPDLARWGYDHAAPYSGRMCSAGSGGAIGPLDAFLAMGAAALGDPEAATRHADRAIEQARSWGLPVAEAWVRRLRERHGF
jgi:DNA-binding SARP family transcriptional activator